MNDKRSSIVLAAVLSLSALVASPVLAATVTGRVIDKDTEEGLAKATITVLGGSNERKEVSGKGGAFNLGNLASGTYTLIVERSGYAPQKISFKLGEAGKSLEIGLASKVYEGAEVKVSARAPSLKKNTVSQTTVGREELKRIPGATHDPLKAATNMPGITPASPFLSAPTVRGGGINDNAYLLDRFMIGNPFHFGGIVSALGSDVVEDFNLYTGAFPARYGNATGGIFELEGRHPRTDRLGGTLDTNLLWSSLFLNGPLNDKLSFSLSGRRSYIDLLIGKALPDFTAFPRFYDYLGRLEWKPDKRNTVTAMSFANDDFMDFKMPASASVDSGIVGNVNDSMGSTTQGVSWKSSLSDQLASELTLSRNTYYAHVGIGADSHLDTETRLYTAREDLSLRLFEGHELGLGTQYDTADVGVDADFPMPPSRPDEYAGKKWNEIPHIKTNSNYKLGMLSTYAEDKWQLSEPLILTYGLRFDRLTETKKNALSPRLGMAFRPDEKTTLRLGWGQFYQFPLDSKTAAGFGNPGLGYEHARHTVAGLEHQFGENLLGKLEFYHKELDELAAPDPVSKYKNTGGGFARGFELSANLKPSLVDLPLFGKVEGMSGQLSYAYCQSDRWDALGAPRYVYDYSQPHVVTLLLDYPLPRDWKSGLKWRYLTGTPYTPYVGRTQDPTTKNWTPVSGERNSKRLPDFSSLDLRFEHKGAFFGREANYYIELLNALNQEQVVGYSYEKDYSNFATPKKQTGLPVIPFLGLELEF